MDNDYDSPHLSDNFNNTPSQPQAPAKKTSSQQHKTGKSKSKVANQPSSTSPKSIRDHVKCPAESESDNDDPPASTTLHKLKQNPKAAK